MKQREHTPNIGEPVHQYAPDAMGGDGELRLQRQALKMPYEIIHHKRQEVRAISSHHHVNVRYPTMLFVLNRIGQLPANAVAIKATAFKGVARK